MQAEFPNLFRPFTIGGLTLANRVVMAPMSTSLGGADGAITPRNIAFYRERALGGFGLIIVEFTCVDPATGRTETHQLSLDSRRNLDGHKRLVDTLHDAGSKVFLQLQHGGRFAPARLLPPGGRTKGPSEVVSRKDPGKVVVHAMDGSDIARLIDAFHTTASLAAEAGYDGIELHGAHGYLLSQFLSPFSNQRDDAWGGDFERRMAFPIAVTRAVKNAIGALPLSFRVSADEFLGDKGLTIEDNVRIVPHLVAAGADLLHASTGRGPEAFDKVMEAISAPEGWRLPYARRLREASGVPVIGVGQIRWPVTAEAALADGDCDLVALGRPSLADPEWPNKARAGRIAEIRPCTSCNWCIVPGREPVGCAENPRAGNELDALIPPDLGSGRRAAVIGAGPGGMAAALMLDQAGFETHIFEARDDLGGGLIASATPPGKDKLFWYRDYLVRRLDESSVFIHRGERVNGQALIALTPDLAFVAGGTRARSMAIPGIDDPMVVEAYELLMGHADAGFAPGDTVIVYGGGETGCETAEYCAAHGARVVLVTRSAARDLARSAEIVYRLGLVARLKASAAIDIVPETHVTHIGDGRVTVSDKDGARRSIPATRLFLAQGRDSDNAIADVLMAAGIPCHVIGDARQPGRIGDAVYAAYQATRALIASEHALTRIAC